MLFVFRNSTILLFLFIIFQSGCFSGNNAPSEQLISASDPKVDFNVLRKTLEEAHPGLYWYTDKAAMDVFFDSSKTCIDHDMTSIEFFKFLLPVIANVKCVHTNLQLPAGNDTAANQFRRLLPFDFYCQNSKLYIRKALNGDGHEGSEVTSINGVNTEQIFHRLLSSLPADGYNESYKFNLLNKGAFREGYALLFGQPENYTIQIRNNSQQLSSFAEKAISPHQIPYAPGTSIPALSLSFHQNMAVLTVNTFEMNSTQFGDSISTIFQTIQQSGTKRLIIDLRQNGGGTNDNVSQLYSYIALVPFLHLKRAEMIATALTYRQFISNTKSLEAFSKHSNKGVVYLVNDQYAAGTKVHLPSPQNLFTGDVILLTAGNTTSAASEFAAIAHFQKRVKIVGEETGGCYYGATGGNYLNLQLPHSGLEVRIPTIRILTAVDEDFSHRPKGYGTLPDYQISPTIDDVINGKDIQLEMAINLLTD